MPTILAIDTATPACSVALSLADGRVVQRFEMAEQTHTYKLLPMVQDVLSQAQLPLSRVDAIACGMGPGSFTGIRIGVGAVQGLALGVDCPVIGISNLEALAQGTWRLQGVVQVVTAIDARMQEVYLAAWHRENQTWHVQLEQQLVTPKQLTLSFPHDASWCCVGSGFRVYPELLVQMHRAQYYSDIELSHAVDILSLAQTRWAQGAAVAPEELQPLYLRNQVAWQK